MAHEMTENDSAVYHAKRAWHGLGTVVPDSMSVMDAYDKSGLGWDVIKTAGIHVGPTWTEDYQGVIREDTEEVLGVVSPRYKPLQNHEVFDLAQYFSSVATVESAGSIQGGRRNYLLLHSDSFEATSNDLMERYMALIWGHDGKISLTVRPTSIRVVCKNTMDMVLNSTTESLSIRHSGDLEEKISEARRVISEYKRTGTLFETYVKHLANQPINNDQLRRFFYDVYNRYWEQIPTNPQTEKEDTAFTKAATTITNWEDTFEEETKDISPSPWLAVNAVTNYIQHKPPSRGRKASADSKALNNLAGANAKKTKDIMMMAVAS